MKPPIPKDEQIRALAAGHTHVYKLLGNYLGDLNKVVDFWQYLTVTKTELAEFLRRNPSLAAQHISDPNAPKYHEAPVLEQTPTGYRVYEIDHGQPRDVQEFADLVDAAAAFLSYGLGLRP